MRLHECAVPGFPDIGHVFEAEISQGVLRILNDERRRVLVELVGARPDPAVLGLLEDDGEGVVERLVRTEPDELAFADVDAGETVAARDGARALVNDGDVVPVGELPANGLCRGRVVTLHVFQRVVGRDNAPTECVIGLAALENHDLVIGIAQLHRDHEIEARRTSPQTCNPHDACAPVRQFQTVFDLKHHSDRRIFQD